MPNDDDIIDLVPVQNRDGTVEYAVRSEAVRMLQQQAAAKKADETASRMADYAEAFRNAPLGYCFTVAALSFVASQVPKRRPRRAKPQRKPRRQRP